MIIPEDFDRRIRLVRDLVALIKHTRAFAQALLLLLSHLMCAGMRIKTCLLLCFRFIFPQKVDLIHCSQMCGMRLKTCIVVKK